MKPLLDFKMYQSPVDARYTPMSVVPSPSKSPATGVSVLMPQVYALYVVKSVLDLRMYQAPVDGR